MLQEDTNEAGAFCLKKAPDVNTAKGPETRQTDDKVFGAACKTTEQGPLPQHRAGTSELNHCPEAGPWLMPGSLRKPWTWWCQESRR